jgi:hypothetical protein
MRRDDHDHGNRDVEEQAGTRAIITEETHAGQLAKSMR